MENNEPSYKEKFEILTDASPDCIKLFGLDNKIIFMNRGGLLEHGFKKPEDAIGFDWVKTVVPEQQEMVLEKIQECVRDKKTIQFEIRHSLEFANREWDSMIIYLVFDDGGKVKYFVGISRDISELKKINADLEKMNKFMINRELKLSELRVENEALKKRIEELGNK